MHSQTILMLLILTPCIMLHALGMDIFVSCTPEIKASLTATQQEIQDVLGFFMISSGLGQIIAGPIADSIGRKKTMLMAAMIYFIGAVSCALAPNITFLKYARLFKGFGACGTLICSWAIVIDYFDKDFTPKAYSYLNAAVGVTPLLAPILGSYLLVAFNSWRATFWFLAVFSSMVMILVWFKLPETAAKIKKLKVAAILKIYKDIYTNLKFLGFSFVGVTSLSGLYLFFSITPFILINKLGYSEKQYALFFGLNALVYLISCVIVTHIVPRLGIYKSILLGLIIALVGSGIILLVNAKLSSNAYTTILPMLVLTFGLGFVMGPTTSATIHLYDEHTGKVAAAFGVLQFCGSSLVGSIAVVLFKTEVTAIAMPMLVLCIFSIIFLAKMIIKK